MKKFLLTPCPWYHLSNGHWTLCLGLILVPAGCRSHQTPKVGILPTAVPTPTLLLTPRRVPQTKPPTKATIISGVKTQRKVIALTFDDGPNPSWTPQVLAILKKRHVPATFFMVGKMVGAHPQSARKVKESQYPIGNHSWSHPYSTRFPQAEIERTNAIIQKVLQIKPTLFRPPYGILSNGLAKTALAQGLNVVIWNDHGADWDKKATSNSITKKVLKGSKRGGIILLHDGGGNRSHTVAALPRIIDGLRRRGYRFVTIPELLAIGPALHVPVLPSPRSKAHFKTKKNFVAKSVAKRSSSQ